MLDVTFRRDSRDRLSSVFADGHAAFADHGEDIVCAAVSAILQAARLGLQEVVRTPLDVVQESGRLELRWPEARRDDEALKAILTTAELSVRQIAAQYPTHVRYSRETET